MSTTVTVSSTGLTRRTTSFGWSGPGLIPDVQPTSMQSGHLAGEKTGHLTRQKLSRWPMRLGGLCVVSVIVGPAVSPVGGSAPIRLVHSITTWGSTAVPMEFGGLDTCPMQPPQMPDALGGMRSGKSTALRGWTRCGITETLRALITLKGPQWSQRFQWSQWNWSRAHA